MQKTIHCWSKFQWNSWATTQLYFFQIISQILSKLFPLKCSLVPLEEQFWFYIDQKTTWLHSFERYFSLKFTGANGPISSYCLSWKHAMCTVVLSKESKEKCCPQIFCVWMFVFSIFYNLSLFLTYISLAVVV